MKKPFDRKQLLHTIGKILLLGIVLVAAWCLMPFLFMAYWMLSAAGLHPVLQICLLLAVLGPIPLLFLKKSQPYLKFYGIFVAVTLVASVSNVIWYQYDKSLIVDTNPNIEVYKYYPGYENNLLVELPQDASLQFTKDDQLPRIDGATAVFPVYSAFVNEVYPENTLLYRTDIWDGDNNRIQDYWEGSDEYQYNNTVRGYRALAERETDIFFGAYPSQYQLDYAAEQGTEFVFTPIGYEAFVFFVHKDNPVDSLTVEQIQGIYSGEITNWAQVGGNFEPIRAYQRNENSGSQSQLIRFMDGKELMDPPSELRAGGMGGIIESVSDYRSSTASIGFSFRYYVEVMVANPDIKVLKVNGVAPTMENIHSGAYPIVGPLYAVTRESNQNPNVDRLLDWILSPEGQYIIQETGYTPVTPVS